MFNNKNYAFKPVYNFVNFIQWINSTPFGLSELCNLILDAYVFLLKT